MLKFYMAGFLILALISSPVSAKIVEKTPKTTQQIIWLTKYTQIYFTGQQSNQWAKVMAAVMAVESDNCGKKIGEKDPSFGCMQTKVAAVKTAAIFWKIPIPKNDAQIIWKLLTDDKFAIKMGTAYMAYLMKKFNDFDLAIISYNIGEGRVMEMLSAGEPLPQEYLGKITAGWD